RPRRLLRLGRSLAAGRARTHANPARPAGQPATAGAVREQRRQGPGRRDRPGPARASGGLTRCARRRSPVCVTTARPVPRRSVLVMAHPSPARSMPPRTPYEEAVLAIWSDVLGCANIGVYDDFFELGGHSLLAPKVVSRIRKVFGVQIPV